EQVQYADEDVEKLPDADADRLTLQGHADQCEHAADEAVSQREESRPTKARNDPSIKRHDRERGHPRDPPQVSNPIAPEQRADRLANRPYGEIARPETEKEQERCDNRGCFVCMNRC